MDYRIITLTPENFYKCENIGTMKRHADAAKKFYNDLVSGNRITYVYERDEEYLGEISLVFDMNDSDYTIKHKRIYISRLIVKPSERYKGIGKILLAYAINRAKEMLYTEISVGVDFDNYPAMKLYANTGFNQIIFIGEDESGKYIKLLKHI